MISGFGNTASGQGGLNRLISGVGNNVNVAGTVSMLNGAMSGMFKTGLPSTLGLDFGQIGADSGFFNAGTFVSGLFNLGRT